MRLSGELRELRGTDQAVPHFLGHLVRIFDCRVSIRMNFAIADDATPLTFEEVHDTGWSANSDRDRVYGYVASNPVWQDPLMTTALRRRTGVSIAHRADFMTRAEWERLPLFFDIHRPSGVDDSLVGVRWRSHLRGECIVLKRAFGARQFSPDERDLLGLIHTELAPLLELPRHESDVPLTGREQEIFDLLVAGASEKSIAARLKISTHTVHHHVKGIYRKLEIGSRAELMARARNPLRLRAAG